MVLCLQPPILRRLFISMAGTTTPHLISFQFSLQKMSEDGYPQSWHR
jgi:hypothetical protein